MRVQVACTSTLAWILCMVYYTNVLISTSVVCMCIVCTNGILSLLMNSHVRICIYWSLLTVHNHCVQYRTYICNTVHTYVILYCLGLYSFITTSMHYVLVHMTPSIYLSSYSAIVHNVLYVGTALHMAHTYSIYCIIWNNFNVCVTYSRHF